ncbi:hypothetical protein [Marinomonas algicola]|uniref:hypothetical protein n=1 Tax=Marinomonas algicola TaxID=2773454 RepID=UPI00174B0EE8|nr:hypothetical protein [Marinomonas algicola]
MSTLTQQYKNLSKQLKQYPAPDNFYELWAQFLEIKKVFNEEAESRFFKMLEAAPELKQYWDEKERMIKMKSIQTVLHRRPKEECVLLRFFGSVWFGNSDMFDFDFMHAVKNMSEHESKIVRRFLASPFWP